jgi:hypothetical protein
MAEENRTPDKKIGEIQHAEEQTRRTTGHLPPHGPGTPDPKEDVKAYPDRDLSKKKTGSRLCVSEVALALGVHRREIYAAIRSGAIPL